MEPVTHFLTGACLSRAGLNRKTALATITMVLGAEAADIDVVGYFKGSVFGFAHHRGFTHTFLGVPVVAAGVVGFVALLHLARSRLRSNEPVGCPACPPVANPGKPLKPRWGLLYAGAIVAGLSHILLDYTNSYGVRPFAPFNPKWYSWDIVSIVEPLMLLVLFLGLVTPALFSLIQEEIGARQRGPRGRGGAIFALVAILVIWGVRDYQHRRAVAALEARIYHGMEANRVSAYPYSVNPFRWLGVVETDTFYESMHVNSITGDVDFDDRAITRYKPEETPVTLAAKKSYLGRVYLDWAQYPMTQTEQAEVAGPRGPEAGSVVHFYDMRYMYPERPGMTLGGFVELDHILHAVLEQMGRRGAPMRSPQPKTP